MPDLVTSPAIVCAGCGLIGHTKGKCPDRPVLRIPAFVDTDPIPFTVTADPCCQVRWRDVVATAPPTA